MKTCEYITTYDRQGMNHFICNKPVEPGNWCAECEQSLCWAHVTNCYQCGAVLCEDCRQTHAEKTGHDVEMDREKVKRFVAAIVAKIEIQQTMDELTQKVLGRYSYDRES